MPKKVLMTTSSPNDVYVIKKAHELGYELYLANSYSCDEAPIKKEADKSFVCDASDISEMSKIIKENEIDGIFVTGSDAHLRFYCDIAQANHLFSYATKDQVGIISDKINFKKNCKKFGLNIIREYEIHENDNIKEIDIEFPVMVKSPDNSGGSKGMTLVYEEKQLKKAIELARSYSPTHSCIIEHFIDGDEFVINYFFVDGQPFVLYTKDYCKNIVDGMVMRDNAMISPSKYEKLFFVKEW